MTLESHFDSFRLQFEAAKQYLRLFDILNIQRLFSASTAIANANSRPTLLVSTTALLKIRLILLFLLENVANFKMHEFVENF